MKTLLEALSPAATLLMHRGMSAGTALVVVTLATGAYTAGMVAWFRKH